MLEQISRVMLRPRGYVAARRAQQSVRVRRIGFLRAAPPSERKLEAFLRGLVDHGRVQGRNFVLVPQWGEPLGDLREVGCWTGREGLSSTRVSTRSIKDHQDSRAG